MIETRRVEAERDISHLHVVVTGKMLPDRNIFRLEHIVAREQDQCCLNNEDTTLNKGSILVLGWVPLLTCGTQPNRGYQNRPPKQSDLPTAAISCAPCRISCVQDRVRCGELQSFDRLETTVCSFPTPVFRSLFIAKPVLDMIVNF
ncbi:hypothetical protein AVEN_99829-1 [Araneus ventricosus]|uniref:Uncharacterized protein n=1 Tax=Araneus ventricosus TaxID=182803 RepID=A0A4Y2JPU7_ARAVE|nr:hypothetical protein AVEN_99829-1 [Araneus ventricosus]